MSGDTSTAALIMFGIDDSGKPHASVFDEGDAEAARQASELMGMRFLALTPGEHADIVAQLPAGRLFESGKAFVPFVKGELYDRIAVLAGPASAIEAQTATQQPAHPQNAPTGSPEAVAGIADERPSPPSPPADPWADIGPGSIVLASEGKDEPWYEARVLSQKSKGIFTLSFVGYPEEGRFDRQIKQLGLLHPSVAAKSKR